VGYFATFQRIKNLRHGLKAHMSYLPFWLTNFDVLKAYYLVLSISLGAIEVTFCSKMKG